MVRNRAGSRTRRANTMFEVIRCLGAGVTNRGRSGASYALRVKTMINGGGKVKNGTQKYTGSPGKNDRLTTRRTACGSVRDHFVEAGLAKLVRDIVRCMEVDMYVSVLEANEAMLKAETELNGGLKGAR